MPSDNAPKPERADFSGPTRVAVHVVDVNPCALTDVLICLERARAEGCLDAEQIDRLAPLVDGLRRAADADATVPSDPGRYQSHIDRMAIRGVRGPREFGRNEHVEPCDGRDCPCYHEGQSMEALGHLDVLDHFCRVDAELVRERLALAEADRG